MQVCKLPSDTPFKIKTSFKKDRGSYIDHAGKKYSTVGRRNLVGVLTARRLEWVGRVLSGPEDRLRSEAPLWFDVSALVLLFFARLPKLKGWDVGPRPRADHYFDIEIAFLSSLLQRCAV